MLDLGIISTHFQKPTDTKVINQFSTLRTYVCLESPVTAYLKQMSKL